jgi:multidrug efflux system membrane fusion protein
MDQIPLNTQHNSRVTHKKWIIFVVLLVVVAACLGLYFTQKNDKPIKSAEKDKANRPQPVATRDVVRQDIRELVTALGTLTAFNTSVVRSRVDGVLLRIRYTEGSTVKEGDLLAEIDPAPYEAALKNAQGQLQRDQALLKNAELDLQRYEDLWRKDSIAKQQLDTQSALVAQLRGTAQTDQALVDTAKLNLSYTKIKAPIGGRLGLRLVDTGNFIKASDANGLVTITQHQPIAVVFAVPDKYLRKIQAKLKSQQSLEVEAWDREQSNLLAKGKVQVMDNAVDVTTGTLKLKAVFPNVDETLFPNQFVNVRLQVDTLKDALAVPANAVQRGSIGTFVYAVNEDNTVSLKKIETGVSDGDYVAVTGELEAGQKLVTEGADRLREGAKVEQMAAKPARRGKEKSAQ